MSANVDIGYHVIEDWVVDYFHTLQRDPSFGPRPLLTQEMLKSGCESELSYDVVREDIFNDLNHLFFVDNESLHYDEVLIL